eukprot:131826-Alexandrium_andersonii.AAC.1
MAGDAKRGPRLRNRTLEMGGAACETGARAATRLKALRAGARLRPRWRLPPRPWAAWRPRRWQSIRLPRA